MIPPSSISVALALAHCVARKDLWLADRELSFEWPVSGLPDLVYMDNAKEFHAEVLRNAAQEYGIDLELRPRGLPQLRRRLSLRGIHSATGTHQQGLHHGRRHRPGSAG